MSTWSLSGVRLGFLVARGNNRNNGASLGAACLNANNGLANSNGNNWRSRLSCLCKGLN